MRLLAILIVGLTAACTSMNTAGTAPATVAPVLTSADARWSGSRSTISRRTGRFG